MDRMDEDYVESDVVQRDPEAINSLLEIGRGFAKYLQDIIKCHEKILIEECDYSKNLAKAYLQFRPWTTPAYKDKTFFIPLKKIYESSTFQSTQGISYLDDDKYARAYQVLEDLKSARNEFITQSKACKDQWKAINAKVADARDAHRAAETLYNRLGRERQRLGPLIGEESGSIDGSSSDACEMGSVDFLESLRNAAGGGTNTMNKRERQRANLESRFLEAEEEYRNNVNMLNFRICERSEVHVTLLSKLRKVFRDVDDTLVHAERTFLILRREKLHESLVKIESQLNVIRDYKPQSCFFEWVEDRMRNPMSNTEDSSVTFVPYFTNGNCKESRSSNSSIPPLSPATLCRNRQSSLNMTASQEGGLSSEFRDSVDGSSDGSTPGSMRKDPLRNSCDSAPKTPPEGPSGEEELRLQTVSSVSSSKSLWLLRPLRNILGVRAGSAGSGSTSPPPSSGSQEDDLQKVEQVVTLCISALERKGLDTTGLYRRGASEVKTNKVLAQLEENMEVEILTEEDPHIICNVIKKCFLKMREPLFTEALHSKFVQIGAMTEVEETLAQLKEVIALLPQENRRLASHIIHHLQRVAATPENQMSADSLGTCVATLMQTRNLVHLQSVPNSKAITAIANTDEIRRVLTVVIENADLLFDASERTNFCIQPERKLSEEMPRSVTSPLPSVSNSESISDDAKCFVTSRQMSENLSTSSQVSCSVYLDSTTQRFTGKGPPFSTSACCSPPPVETNTRPASTSVVPRPQSPSVPNFGSVQVKDTPPPVPPSLGHSRPFEAISRKFSNDSKSPKTRAEVRLRTRFSSTNTRSCNSEVFDDRLLLFETSSGSSRQSAFQMIDSSDDESSGRSYSSVFY